MKDLKRGELKLFKKNILNTKNRMLFTGISKFMEPEWTMKKGVRMNALAWDDYTAAITRIDFYYYKSPSTSKYITSVDDVLFNFI